MTAHFIISGLFSDLVAQLGTQTSAAELQHLQRFCCRCSCWQTLSLTSGSWVFTASQKAQTPSIAQEWHHALMDVCAPQAWTFWADWLGQKGLNYFPRLLLLAFHVFCKLKWKRTWTESRCSRWMNSCQFQWMLEGDPETYSSSG